MLAVTNHLLVLHGPKHPFQENLVQDFARHRGETDWSVVPWVIHFPLLENGGYIVIQTIVTHIRESIWNCKYFQRPMK